MCGVIGLVFERSRADLGRIAKELLCTLEYRGYDSTGAAIQGDTEAVDLRKDVGAPSVMVERLGVDQLGGRILCGQVRWATFGAVDQKNAQPHLVSCRTRIYGAHNGNVTNTDELKAWLQDEGHEVRSDNDGEIVVHMVEHAFAEELARIEEPEEEGSRRRAMRSALVSSSARIKGSYSAIIVDPKTRTLWAVKRGSSLYFGFGESEAGGFGIASSDLSAVLKLSRVLVPLAEGELVEIDAKSHRLIRLSSGEELERAPVRSRLRARDTSLLPAFATYMEQEIFAQVETSREVVQMFAGPDESVARAQALFSQLSEGQQASILGGLDRLRDQVSDEAILEELHSLLRRDGLGLLIEEARQEARNELSVAGFGSSEQALFSDLSRNATSGEEQLAVRLLDALLQFQEHQEHRRAVVAFSETVLEAQRRGGRLFVVCCGSSFHAAKTASLFFGEIASVDLFPLLPGEFRGQFSKNLRDGDVFLAVSQSGETKDVVDAVNEVIASGRAIKRVALVNNLNSTLAQEKAEIVIPLGCGPEIAVAATKSFMNQLVVFYCLALELAARSKGEDFVRTRREGLRQLPALLARTLAETDQPLDEAARFLYLRPSIHILATRLLGVAKEGALKIREVVLNHTEGFEASEFKHGPNTILGFNTVFGVDQIARLLDRIAREGEQLEPPELQALLRCALSVQHGGGPGPAWIREALYCDYPLLYVTGPGAQDVSLTISQINTHKIRGASTVVIAEDDPSLRLAATKPPADNKDYRSIYVTLPSTGDALMTTMMATVALQRLALKMSLMKKAHLDALGISAHGVHPDVPKNVSKSITVD